MMLKLIWQSRPFWRQAAGLDARLCRLEARWGAATLAVRLPPGPFPPRTVRLLTGLHLPECLALCSTLTLAWWSRRNFVRDRMQDKLDKLDARVTELETTLLQKEGALQRAEMRAQVLEYERNAAAEKAVLADARRLEMEAGHNRLQAEIRTLHERLREAEERRR